MGKRKKRHGMVIWVDRWMTSSAFRASQEARGLYLAMMMAAWVSEDCALPNDHDEIRRSTGTSEVEWERAWPRISRYWRVDGDRLVNDTLREVCDQTERYQEQRSIAGRRSAAKRWGNEIGNGTGNETGNGTGNETATKKCHPDPDTDLAVCESSIPSKASSSFVVSPETGADDGTDTGGGRDEPQEAAQEAPGRDEPSPRTGGPHDPSIAEQRPAREPRDQATKLVQAWIRLCPPPRWPSPRIPLARGIRDAANRALKRDSLEAWEEIFARVSRSPWLSGAVDGSKRGWICDFMWVIKPENTARIESGRYDPRAVEPEPEEDAAEREFRETQELMRRRRERDERPAAISAAAGFQAPRIGGGYLA